MQKEDGSSIDEGSLLTLHTEEKGTQTVEEIWVEPLKEQLVFVEDHLIHL